MREFGTEQVTVNQASVAALIGVWPNTVSNMIDDGRLIPDRYSLSYGTEAFSLSYVIDYCKEHGIALDLDAIASKMSEGGAILAP